MLCWVTAYDDKMFGLQRRAEKLLRIYLLLSTKGPFVDECKCFWNPHYEILKSCELDGADSISGGYVRSKRLKVGNHNLIQLEQWRVFYNQWLQTCWPVSCMQSLSVKLTTNKQVNHTTLSWSNWISNAQQYLYINQGNLRLRTILLRAQIYLSNSASKII